MPKSSRKRNLKVRITKLRKQKKTYAEISKQLKCSISTVCYYLNSDYQSGLRKLKERLVKLFGGKCKLCGYDYCIAALHFHHINPKDKKFGISQSRIRNFEKLKKEAEKCILVCSNCHAEIESGLIKL